MEVRVVVSLPSGADRSYWRIEVDNNSACSLIEVLFPYISGISKSGQPSAAIPRYTWGNIEKNIIHTRGVYPCIYWPIQFLALLEDRSGLYIAYEDPLCVHKCFDLKPGDFFSFTCWAENASLPGNDFVSPGPVAIGVCGPDWWKAAKMYRRWALEQKWTSRGPLTVQSTVPEAGKNVGVWFNEYCSPHGLEEQQQRIAAAAEFYQIPFSMQIYFWHKPIDDRKFPEYFPARPDFKPLVETLLSYPGTLAMPYVNGRLQDVSVKSAEDARPYMVKKRDGKIHIENYDPGIYFAVMCPATEYWQKVMIDVSRRLVEEYGVNAIYFDQVAAAEPIDCYDPTHNHTLGGGGYWVEGYRKMFQGVKELKTKSGEPVFLASENTAECYMDTIDAFLTWTPRNPTDIPLLTAVYSGYTIYFATNPQYEESDGLAPYAMAVGRDVLWGTQPGWTRIDTTSERGIYLRDVSRIRYAARRFFQFGELVGELKPLSDPGVAKCRWKNIDYMDASKIYEVSLPAVMGTIWKSPDGELGLMMANLTGEERVFSYKINIENYDLTPGEKGWKIQQIEYEKTHNLGHISTGVLSRDEKLKPWEFRVLSISAED